MISMKALQKAVADATMTIERANEIALSPAPVGLGRPYEAPGEQKKRTKPNANALNGVVSVKEMIAKLELYQGKLGVRAIITGNERVAAASRSFDEALLALGNIGEDEV
jgi:hypothetical protein